MSTINPSYLRHLAIFASVVECGSFAAAARQMNTSRSRVSEQVAQLEQVLGVRLLQRSTRQLTITSEGQRVYGHARALPRILQDVEAIVSSPEPHGRVLLTVNHDIAHKHLLPRLHAFRKRYPLIQLDLVLDDDKLDLIHEQIDLGIRIGIPQDDSLVARVLHEECLLLYASPDYLKKYGKPQTVRELKRHQWIALSQKTRTGVHQLRQRGKLLEVQPQNYTLCNSPLMLQQMVLAGHGIGAIFGSMIRKEIAKGQLVPILPSVASDPVVFYLIYPSRRQVPLRTRVLIDFLLEQNLVGNS
ncbi:MAG: LysR family transcriptional regulator [Granulosicoccus sp.]